MDNKQTRTATKKKKPRRLDNIESGEESDGQSAKRQVDEAEKEKGACRGPENKSLAGFHTPLPVLVGNKPRWQFKCKQCEWYVLCAFQLPSPQNLLFSNRSVRTVERTLKGKDADFKNEPTLPKLSNLATHLTTCKGKVEEADTDGEGGKTDLKFNHQRSLDFMADYLRAGDLNPAIEPTQEGFYRLFAAWILDESLPWTMGEAPTLSLLFRYARIHFKTPSDTTVRTYLSKIYEELHAKVVKEIAVSLKASVQAVPDIPLDCRA